MRTASGSQPRIREGWVLAMVTVATVVVFWASPLSFLPVPWPDDSAFYLPAIDWIHWPSHYRMHAQAPFVPSYDEANFNTMPALPLLLGIGNLLGLGSLHSIRIYGMLAMGAWAALLGIWARRRDAGRFWSWAIALAAVFSPPVRWGSMLVRPEIWIGLAWVLILMELDGAFRKPSAWRLPILFAGSAYFHFEAVVWVLPVAFALRDPKRLLGVAWRTVVLLSPWLAYVASHPALFVSQMHTQFGRLDERGNPFVSTWYSTFHSLFMGLGWPLESPKFFNLGKMITWAILVVTTARCAGLVLRRGRGNDSPARVAALAGLAATGYLWVTKPEVWFTVLVHLSFWPIVVLAIPHGQARLKAPVNARWLSALPRAAVALLLVLEVGVAAQQWLKIGPVFTWQRYNRWIDCLDSYVGKSQSVWEPMDPDVLVELAHRTPGRDYSRHIDFPHVEDLARRHAETVDAIIHTTFFKADDPSATREYRGLPAEFDRKILLEHPMIWYRQYSGIFPEARRAIGVCQEGPFWGAVSTKK